MNFRFPVFLDVGGKRCVVTGEGFEVPQKVLALADAGADVIYINPEAEARIAELAEQGRISWEQRQFTPGDLGGCFLVIADTDHNAEIFQLCEQSAVLCNCVDDPRHCRFSFGSLHRQGELSIAISTNGWAPAIAVRLRQWLEKEIGPEYAVLLDMLKNVRPEISARVGDFDARKNLWYQIVDSNILDLLRDGQRSQAETLVRQKIDAAANNTSHSDISGDSVDR